MGLRRDQQYTYSARAMNDGDLERRAMMELRDGGHTGDGDRQLPPDVPPRVLIAFDQLTVEEQAAVLAALKVLARDFAHAI